MNYLILVSKSIMQQYVYFLIIAGCLSLGVIHQANAQERSSAKTQHFLAIKNNLSIAVDSQNKADIIKAIYSFQPFTSSDNKLLKKLAYYYMAYGYYRLNTIFTNISEDQREKYLDETVKYLKKDVKIAPNFAEAWALLGEAYGTKASGGMLSGMRYGPKAGRITKKALKIAPENPRVRFINAMGLLMTPSMFGGSTKGAIKEFKKAAELFRTCQPKNKLMPGWGHAEVYAWLGNAYKKAEMYKKTKMAYKQALKVDPDYGWVKHKLLPELEKVMK